MAAATRAHPTVLPAIVGRASSPLAGRFQGVNRRRARSRPELEVAEEGGFLWRTDDRRVNSLGESRPIWMANLGVLTGRHDQPEGQPARINCE